MALNLSGPQAEIRGPAFPQPKAEAPSNASLAAGIVGGCCLNSGHFTIRKGGGEARRLMRVLVEPEADRALEGSTERVATAYASP